MNDNDKWARSIKLWKNLIGYVAILYGAIALFFEHYSTHTKVGWVHYDFGQNHEVFGLLLIAGGLIWLYLIKIKII